MWLYNGILFVPQRATHCSGCVPIEGLLLLCYYVMTVPTVSLVIPPSAVSLLQWFLLLYTYRMPPFSGSLCNTFYFVPLLGNCLLLCTSVVYNWFWTHFYVCLSSFLLAVHTHFAWMYIHTCNLFLSFSHFYIHTLYWLTNL